MPNFLDPGREDQRCAVLIGFQLGLRAQPGVQVVSAIADSQDPAGPEFGTWQREFLEDRGVALAQQL